MLLAALIAGIGLLAVAAPALAQPPPPSASVASTEPEEAISVDGTLRSGGTELAGVTVEVLDSRGEQVDETTSDLSLIHISEPTRPY